jgi:hypothetical protein
VAWLVEVLTVNPHAARPALVEKRRQELLDQGKRWRVTLDKVSVTRELISKPDRKSAEEFADLVRADAAEHGMSGEVHVRIFETPARRGPRGSQPRLNLLGGAMR